jgi:hypothetical protein
MTSSNQKFVVAVLFVAISLAAASASASITRLLGPSVIFHESRLFVKFDAAYDSANNVYLVVWGTQAAGPVNGLFLDRAGNPISGIFAISEGPQQSGWARVVYSPQQGRFLVGYTKILGSGVHQRAARFVQYAGGPSLPLPEIILSTWSGSPGTGTGLTYSPGAGKFLVTWWTWQPAPYPQSWIATVDPSTNTAGPPVLVSNPADAGSDPEIACDPASNRCLVVGWSWGLTNGNLNTIWGRLIEASSGTPLGNAFVVDGSPLESEPKVGFAAGRFVVGFVRNFSSVWTRTVGPDGSLTPPQPIAQSAGEGTIDGGGYGTISLAANPGLGTLYVSMLTWSSYPAVQELDANGSAVAGSFSIIPNASPSYDRRSKETAVAVDPAASQILVVDNDQFLRGRSTLFGAGGAPPPPPPPPATPDTRLYVDSPRNGATVAGTLAISGWALDVNASAGNGVDAVHAYAFPLGGGQIFLGSAPFTQRLDVANYFGDSRFSNSGFTVFANLPPGIYTIGVYARSTVTGTFHAVWTVQIRVTPPSNPHMALDQPLAGWPSVPSSFWIRGWALDASSFEGSGVDAVHAWAYPVIGADHGAPVWVGAASVGTYRPDVAQALGNGQFANAGFEMVGTLPPGVYDLVIYARSWIAGSFNNWRMVRIIVTN